MARPFPTTFDDGSPMTPQSAGGSNMFRADINRKKTKKWTQAKAVDYGGDDWGDEDDYGYGYEEPAPPAPVSKPTGLRQQGQVLPSQPNTEHPSVDSGKAYGQLSGIQGATNNPRERSNSFDAGEERNFSNTTVRQPSPSALNHSGPATRFSQITGQHSTRDPSGPPPLSISTQPPHATGLRKMSQTITPVAEPSSQNIPMRSIEPTYQVSSNSSSAITPGSETRTPSSDFQARRDFSPSAMPQPLSARGSPAPPDSRERSASITKFPARKSSLSQAGRPDLDTIMPPSVNTATPKPWVTGGRSSSPSAAIRTPTSPSSTGKNLPFIRPADIYKKAEEERQSMDSGRPSMDSLMGNRNSVDSPLKQRPARNSLDEDGSESGRRLQPMLDTVAERKSEYGFDGFNVGTQAGHTGLSSNSPQSSGIDNLAVEDERRQSTSPKLPDLNRISGFGVDMFSTPSASESQAQTQTPVSTFARNEPQASQKPEHSLHSRPSIGLRSVVQQAFDRTDDSSVPPTPASQTGSGIRRTDSESTGTTGISPIMSRAPSAAVPEGRHPAAGILEVVNESNSPINDNRSEATPVQPQAIVPGFKPGHRRDISTPSPGNSPARAPDLGTSTSDAQGHEAYVSNSDPDITPLENPTRPFAEREQSFRPQLPGGWTSYATSTRSDATPQGSEQGQTSYEFAHEPKTLTSDDEDDPELTPTTMKQRLPHSTIGGILAGPAMDGAASGAAFGTHDRSAEAPQSFDIPRITGGNDALPTPDPAMAPSGSLYSKVPLDPRLLPKLEQAPAETQLRPDAVHRAISAHSSVGPTPPPKDTPQLQDSVEDASYFPSAQPMQQSSSGRNISEETIETPRRPQAIPTISSDTLPDDEENDRLRKEIVKQLSPKGSTSSHYDNPLLATPGSESGGQRESTYLPSEYDSYWDDNAATPPVQRTTSEDTTKANTLPLTHSSNIEAEAPVQPLNTQNDFSERPNVPTLKPRFSWERSTEAIPNAAAPPYRAPETPEAHEQVDPTITHNESIGVSSSHDELPLSPDESLRDFDNSAALASQIPAPTYSGLEFDDRQSSTPDSQPEDKTLGRKSTFLTGGAVLGAGALGAGAAATTIRPSEQNNSQLSLAEEKLPRSSSYPVSPSPPEGDHPSRSPGTYFPADSTQTQTPEHSAAIPSSAPSNPPLQTGIMQFKQIALLPSSRDRIQNYNSQRELHAQFDHGLQNWMTQLQAQNPEHANLASFPAARSNTPRGAGTGPPQMQQPYYQQYLNASSPATPMAAGGSKPGPNTSGGTTQQGFALPGGGKLTGQQVQAKGKELLHTAGIFGGKAGKAGKGLLAKGKSRLRGSGGGEKTSPSAKTKDRRSSWGPLKTLSRTSSGQPEVISQQTNQPSFGSQASHGPTMPSQRNSMSQLTISSGHDRGASISGTPSFGGASPEIHNHYSAENTPREVEDNVREVDDSRRELEDDHGLHVPAPVSKTQPSWDGFNATPLTEEEAFHHDNRSDQTNIASDGVNQSHSIDDRSHLALRSDAMAPKSERSISDENNFDFVPEGGVSGENEWVMVSPASDLPIVSGNDAPATSRTAPALPEHDINNDAAAIDPSAIVDSSTQVAQTTTPTYVRKSSRTSMSIPTSSQEALALVEPEVNQSQAPAAFERESSPTTANIPIPPKHALHHKRASIDLVKRDSIDLAGNRQQMTTGNRTSADLYDVPQHFTAQPETSPERDTNQANPSWLSAGNDSYNNSHSRNVSSISMEDRPRGSPVGESLTPVSSGAISPVHADFPLSDFPQYQPTQMPNQSRAPAEHQQHGKSTFLPPIRRTSTFGIGFGSRQPQTRFPVEDEDDASRRPSHNLNDSVCHVDHEHNSDCIAIQNARNVYDSKRASQISLGSEPTLEHASAVQSSPVKPRMVRVSSFEQSQRGLATQQSDLNFSTRALDSQSGAASHQQLQDGGRPNAALSLTDVSQISRNDMPAAQSRSSWEPQRARGMSGTAPKGAYAERPPWAGAQSKPFEQPPSSAQRYPELFQAAIDRDGSDLPSHYYQQPIGRQDAFLPRQQTNEYQISGVGPPAERPRSSSSRRGSRELFRDLSTRLRGTSRERNGSRSRDGAAGTPPRPFGSRGNDTSTPSLASEEGDLQPRRSAFFGNPHRASTLGLGPPQSRESVVAHHSGSRTDLLSSGRQSPAPDPKKRSFFGSSSASPNPMSNRLSKAATSGNLEDGGKKKRFSGLTGFFGRSEGGSRSSVPASSRPDVARHLPSNQTRRLSEQPSNSNIHSGYSSPAQAVYTPPASSHRDFTAGSNKSSRPVANGRRSSSRSRILSKFGAGPSPQHDGPPKSTVLEGKNKTRRPSGSGLFGGFMSRKSSYQPEREETDKSRSQASTSNTPQPLPEAQTYTDLEQEHQRRQLYDKPYQEDNHVMSEQKRRESHDLRRGPPGEPERGAERRSQRGRPNDREPEYDNVPIPGGYNLVRGHGAAASPTQYDPRGISQYEQSQSPKPSQYHPGPSSQKFPPQAHDPRRYGSTTPTGRDSSSGQFMPPTAQENHDHTDGDGPQSSVYETYRTQPAPSHSPINRQQPPSFGALGTFDTHQSRSAGRRISSEDVLARSPARLVEGQQRPYILSLPDNNDDERPPPISKDSPVVPASSLFSNTSPLGEAKHESVQRLQNPTINHPSSPSGYTIPDATFSPVNPVAKDLPAPPVMPPNWESQSSHLDPHFTSANSPLFNQGSFSGVDRSNTHRTAVSAVSQVSHLSNNDDGRPSLDRVASPHDKETAMYDNSRPRSLSISPERVVSPELDRDYDRIDERDISRDTLQSTPIKNTEVTRGPSLDLYDASPRLPITHTLTTPSPKPSPKVSPIQTAFLPSKPVAPIRMVSPEPNTLAPGSHGTRRSITPASEEKIFVGHEDRGIVHEMDADPTPSMSATSYPGQEWNPYSAGGWEDGAD